MEDGGRSAPMAAELVDRLAIFVSFRRFPGMGIVDSRTLRFDGYVRIQHFVLRTRYVPFRRSRGDVHSCNVFPMLFMVLSGSYLRDAF
jgi:hypothetical protein